MQVQRGGSCSKESVVGSKGPQREMVPNYEGPFVIKKAFSRGALLLRNINDEEFPSHVNSDIFKRYYA